MTECHHLIPQYHDVHVDRSGVASCTCEATETHEICTLVFSEYGRKRMVTLFMSRRDVLNNTHKILLCRPLRRHCYKIGIIIRVVYKRWDAMPEQLNRETTATLYTSLGRVCRSRRRLCVSRRFCDYCLRRVVVTVASWWRAVVTRYGNRAAAFVARDVNST